MCHGFPRMQVGILNIVSLIGALGLLIFGMKIMSEGVQKVAGTGLRRLLSTVTSRRLIGLLSGTITTGLVQSSTAVTVMLVSFVNAGLLTLAESVSVTMGANIGTTLTAWLVAGLGLNEFSVSSLSLPAMALGLILMFLPAQKGKQWAEVLMGFGILFLGLSLMREAVPDLEEMPRVFAFVRDLPYYDQAWLTQLGTLAIFVLIGFVITALLQSSSAAMAITLVLTYEGWISFPLAVGLVLGENIGTTITANIAALVGNVHAKRAARIHLIINLIGVAWALLLFPYLIEGVAWCSQVFLQGDPHTQLDAIPLALAFYHTAFNGLNVALLIGFVPFLVRVAQAWVPSRGEEDELFSLDYLDRGVLATSELSLVEARKQLTKMGDLMRKAYKLVPLLITEMDEGKVRRHAQKLQKYEDISDRMEIEVSSYLSKASEGELSAAGVGKVKAMLHVAHYLERMGDIYLEISRNLTRRKEQKAYFTPDMRNNILRLSEVVQRSLDLMVQNIDRSEEGLSMDEAMELEEKVDAIYKELRNEYLDRVQNGKFRLQSGMYYSDLLTEMERLADHAASITKTLSGEGPTELR